MNKLRIVSLSCALVAAAACGDDNGTGPELGRAEAYVADDPTTANLARAGTGPSLGNAAPAAFSGSIAGEVQVAISADGETWVDLGSPNDITLQLQASGTGTTVHGEVDVPIGTYAHVRLIFSGAEARLSAGSTFGAFTLTTQVDVMMGGSDGEVVIETTVTPFTVTAEGRAVITVDLNAEAWLTDQSVTAQSATDAAIQGAVSLAVTSAE
jgi:hypothetical protein